jgi:glutamyl-tRNA synthetase
VRTALFNWLFARKHGGQFILRIDDTDAGRNVESALQPILHGLKWLGVDWDEGPDDTGTPNGYFQSQRSAQYQAAVAQLLASGHAYRDFAKTEELQQEREAAEKAKETFVYSRRWMAETDADAARFAAEGRAAVVRLKMPREGKLILPDLIRGDVEFEWAKEQDHVIQRADGTCLYHLANVVDDHDFKISHVIRAEEHLSNTPRQVFIIDALGYERPQYAHLPFVAEPGSKNKLSKRKLDKYLKNRDFAQVNEHGRKIAAAMGLEVAAETFNPVIVDFYEQVGYLPDAIINYLLLLGWSLDDKTEMFTREEMIEQFSLERVNKAPASFDPKKLSSFQERYMQQWPIKQKVAKALPYLQRAGVVVSPPPCTTGPELQSLITAIGDRLKVFGDILDYTDFYVADDALTYDEAAFDKRLRQTPGAKELLERFRAELAVVEPFSPESLESLLHQFVEKEKIAIGDIIHGLRLALTGKTVGFGLFDVLAILGREHALARIDRALSR